MRNEHPARRRLAEELHARPFVELPVPGVLSYLALMDEARDEPIEHLRALCGRFGVDPPADTGVTHFAAAFPEFTLHWERHSEFSTYKFIARGCDALDPFAAPAIARVPSDWWQAVPGQVICAGHISVARLADVPADGVQHLIGDGALTCSALMGGRARTWTDFRIRDDGFTRMLVDGTQLGEPEAGRLAQRLQEIEVYRMVAMLALPLAIQARGIIREAEQGLSALTDQLGQVGGDGDDRELLQVLTRLASDIEAITVKCSYRFSATSAYYTLVRRRMAELREVRVQGMQPLCQFLERRMLPAMDTCSNAAERQAAMSHRIAQVTNLLATRVGVSQERQNHELLQSMNQRAQLQIRIQRAVEGLSVAAISYYVLSICSYGFKALAKAGVPIAPDVATGVMIPLVAFGIFLGVRRIRRVLDEHRDGH